MNWTDIDTWILVTALAISMACALPGLFLFLNRDSMVGDAISHGILPGLAIAFLISGSRESWVMLLGAVLAGLLTMTLTGLIKRFGHVDSGASLGVAFSFLFAMGLILIRVAADHVDLDPDCVLYGAIETSVFDVHAVPTIAWVSGIMLGVNLLLLGLFYKELKLAIFDPATATALGFPAGRLRQGLIVVTSITTVVAFQSVGSILVIAMLVVPGATASLLSRSLPVIIGLSLMVAALAAALGVLACIYVAPPLFGVFLPTSEPVSTTVAGSIAVVSGILFAVVLLGHAANCWFSSTNLASPQDELPAKTSLPAGQ